MILIALLLAKWTTQPYFAYLGGVAAMGLALADRDARPSPTTAAHPQKT